MRNKNTDPLLREHHQQKLNMGLILHSYKTPVSTGAKTEGAGAHRLEKPNFDAGLLPSLMISPPMTPKASHMGNRRKSTRTGFQMTG